LFTALTSALSDVPPDRVAGAILITDGRVHDVPGEAAALGFAAPVHALITGHKDERDRRVVLVTAPRFAIVGQTQTITFRVEDQGAPAAPVTTRAGVLVCGTGHQGAGCGGRGCSRTSDGRRNQPGRVPSVETLG